MSLADAAKARRRSPGPKACEYSWLLEDEDLGPELREALSDHDIPFYGIAEELEARGYPTVDRQWLSRHRFRTCKTCVRAERI